MATTYDTELARIQRQRALADALRESGNEPLAPSIRTGGRFDAPVSGWEYANKAMSKLLGAYQGLQADKSQRALDAEDKRNLQDLLEKKRSADQPDDPLAEVTPLAPPPKTQAERQREFQVAAMRGIQYGGSAAPYAQEATTRELFPKEEQPYTLNEGDVRYDKNNNQVAQGLPKEYKTPQPDPVTMKVIDKTKPEGYRTIFRRDFDPAAMNEWEKPNSTGVGEVTPKQESEVEKLAQQVYDYRMPPMPLGTRNPVNAAVMARVADIATEKGKPYNAFEYQAKSRALSNFAAGPEARSVRSFNTMLDHMGDLRAAVDKLNNGEIPALNKIGNWFSEQSGGESVPVVNQIKNVIRAEVVKAVAGSPGAESDRQEALSAVDNAGSPAALHAALDAAEKLGAGQLGNLRRQFVASTGLDDDRFGSWVSPKARSLLSTYSANEAARNTPTTPTAPAATLPPVNARGWVLHTDKNNNKAYVGPNNEIEEVTK